MKKNRVAGTFAYSGFGWGDFYVLDNQAVWCVRSKARELCKQLGLEWKLEVSNV